MVKSVWLCGFLLMANVAFGGNMEDLKIVPIEEQENASVLRSIAAELKFPLSAQDKDLINQMKKKVVELEGVGLAAPQVGYSLKIIAIYIPESAALLRDDAQVYPLHVLINPKYTPVIASGMAEDFEACYSVNSIAGKVKRYNEIELEFYDEQGRKIIKKESGFYARVLQHEIDHLEGILFSDLLGKDSIKGSIKEMMILRRNTLSEEKQQIFDQFLLKKGIKL